MHDKLQYHSGIDYEYTVTDVIIPQAPSGSRKVLFCDIQHQFDERAQM